VPTAAASTSPPKKETTRVFIVRTV
jgi:hypothetical protein